jgi:hypothetical protein
MKLGKITPLLVAVIGDVMLPGSRTKETEPSFAKLRRISGSGGGAVRSRSRFFLLCTGLDLVSPQFQVVLQTFYTSFTIFYY